MHTYFHPQIGQQTCVTSQKTLTHCLPNGSSPQGLTDFQQRLYLICPHRIKYIYTQGFKENVLLIMCERTPCIQKHKPQVNLWPIKQLLFDP